MRNPFAALFDARSIGSSYDLLQYFERGISSLAGPSVSESTAYNVAAVMTCVSLRSRALASLPCKVYERIDERNKKPAVDHPLTRVLSKPNSWQTRAELFSMLEAHRVLRGNAYAWKNLIQVPSTDGVVRDQVAELIPLPPDRVTVTQPTDLGGPLLYVLSKKNGQQVPLPQNEVVHLRGLTSDGVNGRSVLQDAREMIGGAIATQEHSNLTWSQGSMPRMVLRHPKTLSAKAQESLEKKWQATYGGSKDQRRVAVIEEGMEVTPLSVSANDNQFLETRKFQRGEIAGWFHVPPHMLGDTEKQTSWGTGIEQQQIGFLAFTLRPDLVGWEQRLTLDLIQRPDKYFIEFSLDGFMRADSAARGAFYRVMREVGAYSANDIRALENMNPIAEGDTYLQPANLSPLGSVPPTPPALQTGATQ